MYFFFFFFFFYFFFLRISIINHIMASAKARRDEKEFPAEIPQELKAMRESQSATPMSDDSFSMHHSSVHAFRSQIRHVVPKAFFAFFAF